jgi:gliding motility-associated-like protein
MSGHLPYPMGVVQKMWGMLKVMPGMLVLVLGASAGVQAQCPTTITSFPYTESFEAGPAWTSGGVGDDWAWGAPAHPTINSAADGTNAWCVGGLTGSFYNFGQQSFLEGPCFDLSGLAYPYVSFSLFWECERNFDGLGFQYSLDGGVTWNNVGAVNGPEDCINTNWFNTSNITNLQLASPRNGWSGRIGATQGSCAGGQGSEGWVTAGQCIGNLAGQSSVKFRFVFGAGTTCNNYDGIAIDEVYVGEAPPNVASFTYTCNGATVGFTQTAALCPTSYAWNFGDPASGAANTSTSPDPAHAFSAPGTYAVTLTVSGPCNAMSSVTVPVTVLDVNVTATDPTCGVQNGALTATVTGGAGPFTYAWSPGGQNTATITGLGPGSYSVAVSMPNACVAEADAQLDNGAVGPNAGIVTTPVSCFGATDGAATLSVTGGTPPYTYAWSGGLPSVTVQNGLPAGTVSCTVTDANGCAGAAEATVGGPDELVVNAPAALDLCAGAPLTVLVSATGGTPVYSYSWTPPLPYEVLPGNTNYGVVATDQNGCTSAVAITVVNGATAEAPLFTWTDTIGCMPHCVTFSNEGSGDGVFTWDLGNGATSEGAEVEYCYTAAGVFPVTLTVTSAEGCEASLTVPDLIRVWPPPDARIVSSATVVTLDDATFTLSAGGTGWDSCAWSFGDPLGSMAVGPQVAFTYPVAGCYTVALTVWSPEECSASTTRELCVEEEFAIYLPNSFTPNGDGFNDLFRAVSPLLQPRAVELLVFDRWGRAVHRGDALEPGWDGTYNGTAVEPGVYAWRFTLVDAFGIEHLRTGHVTLLR